MIFHYFYKGKEETINTWDFPSGFGFLGAYAEEHIVGFAIIREEDNGKIGVYGIDDKGKFNQGQEDVLDWIDENVSWLVRDNLILDEQSASVELIPTEDYEFDPDNAATYIPNGFIKSCRVIKEGQPEGGGGGGDGDGDDSGGGGYFKRIFWAGRKNAPTDTYERFEQDNFAGAVASIVPLLEAAKAPKIKSIKDTYDFPWETRVAINFEWEEAEFVWKYDIYKGIRGNLSDVNNHETILDIIQEGSPEGTVFNRDSYANYQVGNFRWYRGDLARKIDEFNFSASTHVTYDIYDTVTNETIKNSDLIGVDLDVLEFRCWVSA